MRDAEWWTDHHLVRAKLHLHIQPPRRLQNNLPPKKLNITKLRKDDAADELAKEMDKQLARDTELPDYIE